MVLPAETPWRPSHSPSHHIGVPAGLPANPSLELTRPPLDRYHEDGRRGLQDRSHGPHHCPHRIPPAIADLVCAARRRHPDWGPGKLLDWLAPRHPDIAEAAWPAVSTAGDLLAREGC